MTLLDAEPRPWPALPRQRVRPKLALLLASYSIRQPQPYFRSHRHFVRRCSPVVAPHWPLAARHQSPPRRLLHRGAHRHTPPVARLGWPRRRLHRHSPPFARLCWPRRRRPHVVPGWLPLPVAQDLAPVRLGPGRYTRAAWLVHPSPHTGRTLCCSLRVVRRAPFPPAVTCQSLLWPYLCTVATVPQPFEMRKPSTLLHRAQRSPPWWRRPMYVRSPPGSSCCRARLQPVPVLGQVHRCSRQRPRLQSRSVRRRLSPGAARHCRSRLLSSHCAHA